MALQTSIASRPVAALSGQIADTSSVNDVLSRALETAAGCDAGIALATGATPGTTVKVPAASGDIAKIEGFAVLQMIKEPGATRYAQYDAVPCLTRGRMWIAGATAMTAMAAVYCGHNGAGAGRLLNDATNAVALPGCRCLIGAGADAVGLYDINLTAGQTGPTGPTGP